MSNEKTPRPKRRRWILLLIPVFVGMAFVVKGCSTPIPRRDPVGETFPTVEGESLSGEKMTLPSAFKGKPTLFLVGYKQNSQFDIDRWLIGVTMKKLDVTLAEVPTIPGMVPSMFSGMIDSGMRRGIPKGDWAGVITTYSDEAEKIAKLTGNENPLPARVLLLDADSKIVWFHDEGFSPRILLDLERALLKLKEKTKEDPTKKS